MIPPKERARELVDEFYIKVHDRNGTSAMNYFESKQCALIAVDKMIMVYKSAFEAFKKKFDSEYDVDNSKGIIYLNEIKKEIEKI